MDETDRRGWAEARLYTLYERCFADLQQDILRIDPGHPPGRAHSIWPPKLTREEFRDYLRRSSVGNPDIRWHWVERLLLLAAPEEQAALRDALGHALLDSPGIAPSDEGNDNVTAQAVRRPHFLTKKQKEPSGDGM